ncbi:flagellar assembly protein FliW, partial [Clostridiaceae bacterium HSG29]|nr:flagellar assembly protein FliW [Clostridiaceae bacterium HSG29]
MKLKTPYLGEIEYNLDEIIIFENGLYGFEEKQEFILVNLEDPDFPFNWLQSIADENLSFILTSPFLFINDYEFDLSDNVTDELKIKNHEDVLILNTVVLNEELEK